MCCVRGVGGAYCSAWTGAHPHLPTPLIAWLPHQHPSPSSDLQQPLATTHSQGQPASRPACPHLTPWPASTRKLGRGQRGEGVWQVPPKALYPTCQPLNFCPFFTEPQQRGGRTGLMRAIAAPPPLRAGFPLLSNAGSLGAAGRGLPLPHSHQSPPELDQCPAHSGCSINLLRAGWFSSTGLWAG